MAKTNKIGAVATTMMRDSEGFLCVVYHRTPVVRFKADTVELNSGGYETATTKLRMNQTANQMGLPFNVFAKNRRWFVSVRGGDPVPFVDGMRINVGAGETNGREPALSAARS